MKPIQSKDNDIHTILEDKFSYGVFWKEANRSNEFHQFSAWFSNYGDAYSTYEEVQKNPLCVKAMIVERSEHYEIVAAAVKEKK